MKNLKKVLALVVALTMVFTTVAFASYPDVDTDADYAGAVELLSALGVLQGDDNGNFNPDNTITRAEFSAVVCRALGLEGSANGAKGATAFTDVAADHWASGYINLASQQGIVNGRGNGIFDPEGNVTFTEAVKMLVVALGYEPMAAQRGGWPTGYLTVANSTKLTAGVSATGTDTAALRSTVAQLTANALDIPVMDQTSFGTETKYEPLDDYGTYKSLLTARDIYVVTGVINSVVEKDDEFEFEFTAFPDDYEFGYESNGDTIDNWLDTTASIKTWKIGDSNVADYVGQNVDVYLLKEGKSKYTAVIAVPSGIGETLSIGLDDLELATYNAINGDNGVANDNNYSTLEYYETDDANKTTKIYVKENPTINVNGYKVSDGNNFSLTQSTLANNFTQLTFVENTNDKYYDIIDITIYEYGIVEDVLADKERIELTNGTKVSFDSDDDQQVAKFINAEGAVISLEDIVAGDVLAMVVGDQAASGSIAPKAAKNFDEKITIYNLGQNFVTGSVDSWDEDEHELSIDGTTYEFSTLTWVTDDTYSDLISTGDPLGTEGAFYLGMNGKIIGYDGSKSSSGTYGLIVISKYDATGFTPHYSMKLLTNDGIAVYDVAKKCEINGTTKDVTVANTTGATASASDNQQIALDAFSTEYDNKTMSATVVNRVVEYDVNNNGEIDEIYFVKDKTKTNVVSLTSDTEYKASTAKLGSKVFESDAVIFNVKSNDVDNASVADISYLVDEGTYQGVLLDVNDDKEFDIFVMTVGTSSYNAEGNVYVVDSVTDIKYEDDNAKQVTYYTEGYDDAKTAIFTDDSENTLYDDVADYKKLARGSVFVANVAEDGFAVEYAVIANVVNNAYVFNLQGSITTVKALTAEIYGASEVTSKSNNVEFVYGYISDIDGKTVTLGGTTKQDANGNYYVDSDGRDLTVDSSSAQYAYNNNNSKKTKIEVGDYQALNVDDMLFTTSNGTTTVTANLVFAKLYDDDVVDIISISGRKTVTLNVGGATGGILEQTHFTGPTVDLNSVDEAKAIVDEDIVVEDEISFE